MEPVHAVVLLNILLVKLNFWNKRSQSVVEVVKKV